MARGQPPGPAADAVEELFRSLRRPLEYICRAPAEAAGRTALPVGDIVARSRQLAEVSSEPLAGKLTAVAGCLEGWEEASAADRQQRATQCLALLDAAPVAEAAAKAPVTYRATQGDLAAGQAELARPVQFVRGVGPRRADELRRHGLTTIEDLLFHMPFRYEDRRLVVPVARAVAGQSASFVGELVHLEEKVVGRGNRRILRGVLKDETGLLGLVWFHQVSYFSSRFRRGQQVLAFGRVEADQGGKQIVHPEIATATAGSAAVLPVYHKPGSMSVKAMRSIVAAALDAGAAHVASVLPEQVVAEAEISDLETALRAVHRPGEDVDAEELAEFRSVAHRSIIFDELFYLQLGLALRRRSTTREAGYSFASDGHMRTTVEASLPFELTTAQWRVLEEIADDMAQPHPMHRLVQGDVGSGKTVVALLAGLASVEAGHQVALMAPTELLAEQHHATIANLCAGLDVEIALVTASMARGQRDETRGRLADGSIDIAIGTHALIQEGVRMPRLGLGVIDEQHRFGVLQRAALRELAQGGAASPDVLLMTATPIPRTLSMTVYGDLDVSAIDELPAGRQPVETRVVHEAQRARVYATVRREVDAGRQAYVVYPLVESSEKTDLRDATTMAEELGRTVFASYRVGLLHGRMKADEKEQVMRRFRDGDLQILVSTTVVEVGVDVANATVMVVEHAERFGLSQLHQLRGRVGRGTARSLCLLVTSRRATAGDGDRLAVMQRTHDGFEIAEADLQLRGPGEFLGTRQSGLPDFRAANLLRDTRLLVEARTAAIAWLDRDPGLQGEESQRLRTVLEQRWAKRLGLAEIG